MRADIDKDEAIIQMLNELQAELGDGAFEVVDHWEGDRSAIGVARPDNHGVLVYVSAQDGSGNEYWVSLEFPQKTGEDFPYVPAGEREVHGIRELARVVRSHFGAQHA